MVSDWRHEYICCGILSTVQKNSFSILLGVIQARIILLGSSLADLTVSTYGIWIRSIWQHSDNFIFWFYRFFANTLLRTSQDESILVFYKFYDRKEDVFISFIFFLLSSLLSRELQFICSDAFSSYNFALSF